MFTYRLYADGRVFEYSFAQTRSALNQFLHDFFPEEVIKKGLDKIESSKEKDSVTIRHDNFSAIVVHHPYRNSTYVLEYFYGDNIAVTKKIIEDNPSYTEIHGHTLYKIVDGRYEGLTPNGDNFHPPSRPLFNRDVDYVKKELHVVDMIKDGVVLLDQVYMNRDGDEYKVTRVGVDYMTNRKVVILMPYNIGGEFVVVDLAKFFLIFTLK